MKKILIDQNKSQIGVYPTVNLILFVQFFKRVYMIYIKIKYLSKYYISTRKILINENRQLCENTMTKNTDTIVVC